MRTQVHENDTCCCRSCPACVVKTSEGPGFYASVVLASTAVASRCLRCVVFSLCFFFFFYHAYRSLDVFAGVLLRLFVGHGFHVVGLPLPVVEALFVMVSSSLHLSSLSVAGVVVVIFSS